MKSTNWLLIGAVLAAATFVLVKELLPSSLVAWEKQRITDETVAAIGEQGITVTDDLYSEIEVRANLASLAAAQRDSTIAAVIGGLGVFAACALIPRLMRRKRGASSASPLST